MFRPPDDWNRRDTVLELTYRFTAAIDARTTAHIHDVPGKVETGPLASRVLGVGKLCIDIRESDSMYWSLTFRSPPHPLRFPSVGE